MRRIFRAIVGHSTSAADPRLAALTHAHYSRWFTREELLAAPAASVEETDDGMIWIRLYRDPIAPQREEVKRIGLRLECIARSR
jgi:hypothetical protein